jgi:peptidyl-prolyl cis-trans isomerase C
MRRQALLWAIVLALGLTGCDKLGITSAKKPEVARQSASPAVKGPIVARVNNMPITLEDLNDDINAYNASVPEDNPEAKITTRDQKIKYLRDAVIRQALLYQEALDRGLDRNEAVQKALEKTKMDLLVMELVRQEAEKVDVSSKEIEEYYNTYKDQLKEPEQRRVREIMVPTEQEAKDIMVQILQGGNFAELAREKSKSASAASGGDLGFIDREKDKEKRFTQFDAVAFSDSLESGQVSNIFKGPGGFYIIKIESVKGGKQRTINELWDDIKRALTFLKQQQKINDLINKLNNPAKSKIEIYEGEIK